MKRSFSMLVVVLLLAAAIAFTQRRTGGLGEKFPVRHAADWVPAGTVFYLEMPDLERTAKRWETSDLKKIYVNQDGNWQNDLDSGWWRTMLCFASARTKWTKGAMTSAHLPELQKLEPRGFFLAATSLEPEPQVVGGFPYRGKRSDVERVVRGIKDEFFKAWPGAKSELSLQGGIEVESITAPANGNPSNPPPSTGLKSKYKISKASISFLDATRAVHLAFRDDWLFFATDRDLLAGTLDRYLRKPGAGKSLAQEEAFSEGRAGEVAEPDVVAWTRWEPIGKGWVKGWLPFAVAAWEGRENPARTVHYSVNLEGTMHDRLFLRLTNAPAERWDVAKAFTRARILHFDFDALREPWAHRRPEFMVDQQWWELNLKLNVNGIQPAQLWEAFGPTLGFLFPTGDYTPSPEYLVALEVRDAAKAQAIVEAIVPATKESLRVTWEGDTTRWSWTGGPAYVQGPLVLTKTHLIFGTTSDRSKEKPARKLDPEGLLLSSARIPRSPGTNDEPRPAPWETILAQPQHESFTVRRAGMGWLVESAAGMIGNRIVGNYYLPLLRGYER